MALRTDVASASESPAPRPTRPRARVSVSIVIAVGLLVLAELSVRAMAPDLATPQVWATQESQLKVDQMDALRDRRGGAGTVFVGTSSMGFGLDPGRVESVLHASRPVYNAAVRAVSIAGVARWTELVVVPTLHPDRVVIGITSRELNDNDRGQDGIDRGFFDAAAPRHLERREKVLDTITRVAGDWSYLVRYRTVLRRPLRAFDRHPATVDQKETVAADGMDRSYVVSGAPYRFDRVVRADMLGSAVHDYAIGARRVAALRGLLAYLHARRVDTVVVNMPITDDLVRLHPHGLADYDRYRQVLRATVEGAGARFVDFAPWPTDLFGDPLHLNGRGADRFSREIGALLASPGAT